MGCESSSETNNNVEMKVSIIDSNFMKESNDSVKQQMKAHHISFDYFISLDYFLEEFEKRYYNRVITNVDTYPQLKQSLSQLGFEPKIYVVLHGQNLSEETPGVKKLNSYEHLIEALTDQNPIRALTQMDPQKPPKQRANIKIFRNLTPTIKSQQQIFEAALAKSNITFNVYKSYQQFEQSINESYSQFIVIDYIFQQEVIQCLKANKNRSKIVCLTNFENEQVYPQQVYAYSNNCLDVVTFLKNQLEQNNKSSVKCTRVFLCTNDLPDYNEVALTLQRFNFEVALFDNFEKFLKDAIYFFCVTVLCSESQSKNLTQYLCKNNCISKVKVLTIPETIERTPKGMFKIIRSIRKGYPITKGITNSVDIIDKHFNNAKFQEIKKELDLNGIGCFGFSNIAEYIKQKKIVSSFVICNYEERSLLVRYVAQVELKTKIIVFCNKNKITADLLNNEDFSFVSSHFGKIIKFIKKTPVFLPAFKKQEDEKFKQKINKLKMRNKRISAIKWSGLEELNQSATLNENSFEFLNIAKTTNNGAIRQIYKNVASIWKSEHSILNFSQFKQQFIQSLTELRKIGKINFQETHFNQLINSLKNATMPTMVDKMKSFFDADNQLGLEINKSLLKTESIEKTQISNMRQLILLIFMNFFSGYQMPKLGIKKITRWISNELIEKCETGSYLFCKNFLIFYENNPSLKTEQLGKYKVEVELNYNTLAQSDLMLNNFMAYKDKIVFSPFSQFQLKSITDCGSYKTITLAHIKNIDFLTEIYSDNVLKKGQTLASFTESINKSSSSFVDPTKEHQFTSNISRIQSLAHYQAKQYQKSIEIHLKLIQEMENKEDLNSALINELNFELAHFYYKSGKNREAGKIIKELMESDPGQYIQNECMNIIQNAVGTQQNRRRISEQAMKTFLELKDSQNFKQEVESDKSEEQIILSEEQVQQLQDRFK